MILANGNKNTVDDVPVEMMIEIHLLFILFAPVQEIETPSTCPGVSWYYYNREINDTLFKVSEICKVRHKIWET